RGHPGRPRRRAPPRGRPSSRADSVPLRLDLQEGDDPGPERAGAALAAAALQQAEVVLLEPEVIEAGLAAIEVGPDLLGELRRHFPLEVVVQLLGGLPAVDPITHRGTPEA